MRHYTSRYPRSGQVAILCEGDLVGYEAELLELWTAKHGDLGLVDMWPCGTKTALFGLADAIGRSIPLMVIEDKDFRSTELAARDCRGRLKDRKDRGVHVRGWRAWRRSEIENYLIEPSVLLPVFADAFSVPEADVERALQYVLTNTASDQALQQVLSEFRAAFPSGERDVGGVSRSEGRPRWSEGALAVPTDERIAQAFAELMTATLKKLAPERQPSAEAFLNRFHACRDAWRDAKVSDTTWRVEWAGKDVLAWIRGKMTGDVGWPDPDDPSQRRRIDWGALTRKEFGERDRAIEAALQPRLVGQFMKQLSSGAAEFSEIASEWHEIIDDLRGQNSDAT